MRTKIAFACFAFTLMAGTAKAGWDGWYAGVNLSHSSLDSSTARSITDTSYFASTSITSIQDNSNFSLEDSNVTGGIQFGYNKSASGVVVGLEGDFSFLSAKDGASVTLPYPCCVTTNYTSTAAIDQNWIGSIRGRIGALAGSTLVYATAGVALSDVKLTQGFSDTFTPFAFASQSRSETLTGWALGGGAETPITSQLTLRVEYIYYDLGEIAVGPTQFLSTYPTSLSQTTADVTNESIRIGVNWQF